MILKFNTFNYALIDKRYLRTVYLLHGFAQALRRVAFLLVERDHLPSSGPLSLPLQWTHQPVDSAGCSFEPVLSLSTGQCGICAYLSQAVPARPSLAHDILKKKDADILFLGYLVAAVGPELNWYWSWLKLLGSDNGTGYKEEASGGHDDGGCSG